MEKEFAAVDKQLSQQWRRCAHHLIDTEPSKSTTRDISETRVGVMKWREFDRRSYLADSIVASEMRSFCRLKRPPQSLAKV